MAYTKGEWYLELRPADSVRRVRCGSETIAGVFGTNAEDKANAHLIAAAPDLYEALLLYLDDCEMEELEYNDDTYEAATKALAKVEGK